MEIIFTGDGGARTRPGLNVASAAAWFPGPEQATCFATKAYLAALSNALWYELKPLGIRVTTLLPGLIETSFAQAGQLTQTRLFAPGTGVAPQIVAWVGYAGEAPSDRWGGMVDALGGPLLPLVAETVGIGRDCGFTTVPSVTAG